MTVYYEDPVCGHFGLSFDDGLKGLTVAEKLKIAKVLAMQRLRYGNEFVIITTDRKGPVAAWECVPVDEILSAYPKSTLGVFDEALINIDRMTEFPGDRVVIDSRTRWLVFAHSRSTQAYILRQLFELGFIDESEMTGAEDGGIRHDISIAAGGWKRLQEIEQPNSESRSAFVAMWFDDSMDTFFSNGIKEAISDSGYSPRRIDFTEHNNKICDEIIAEIRRSRFVVADFSGQRGGVYYEAGFASGLGIPVIWTVRKEDLDDVHFDTRQYNHIVYETPDELRQKLKARIEATI